ncbi:MAG: hypothetical protein ABSF29_05975 [Tepidisphaeraceae bacterium]
MSQLSDAQITFRLLRIVASLGVAHTQLTLVPSAIELHVYPISMEWFSDGLAIVGASPEYQSALGDYVVRIGRRAPGEVEQILAPYISHENDAWLRVRSPTYMRCEELMQQEKIVGADGNLELTLAKTDGRLYTLTVLPEAIPMGGELPAPAKRASDVLHIPPTLHSKHPFSYYWYDYLADSRAIYIQYNVCREDPRIGFEDFTKGLFAFADAHPVDRVIVDLRYNNGGNSEIVRPLIDGLVARQALAGMNRVYVLIGPATFSSGLSAAMDFQDSLHAILIGEPTGGKPNCYGDILTFKLPRSQLQVVYSIKNFTPIPDADPPSLDPDIFVSRSLGDFLAGRDPVLNAALGYSPRGRPAKMP